jgi:hypothetical protein
MYSETSSIICSSSGFAQGGIILAYFTEILPHKNNDENDSNSKNDAAADEGFVHRDSPCEEHYIGFLEKSRKSIL